MYVCFRRAEVSSHHSPSTLPQHSLNSGNRILDRIVGRICVLGIPKIMPAMAGIGQLTFLNLFCHLNCHIRGFQNYLLSKTSLAAKV